MELSNRKEGIISFKYLRLYCKARNSLQKFEKYLGIKEPDIPRQISYRTIVEYLRASQRASGRYYMIIFLIGAIGCIVSAIYYFFLKADNEMSALKAYSGFMFSLVTMSFGQIEIELQKRKLYNQLHRVAVANKNSEDLSLIVEDFKKWSWSQYQDKFTEI